MALHVSLYKKVMVVIVGHMDADDLLMDATTALIPPLLTAIDVLTQAGRYLQPQNIAALATEVAPHQGPLQNALETFTAVDWPQHLQGFAAAGEASAQHALHAFEGLLGAEQHSNPVMAAYRAMGQSTRATEALYPLTSMLPPVSRFFLLPTQRDDAALAARLQAAGPGEEGVGVMHAANAREERGGFSLYVPEYYAGEAVPLVVALHGGSGHGRSFLWTWLRAARSRNFILIAPTSQDDTWSLMGPDTDSERLHALVDYARSHWTIDPQRILLTGMSDGGTFSYVSGLQSDSPFTHLAPSSASFHPMLVAVAAPERLHGLPIYLMHGALDWMFPVEVGRSAAEALSDAGAAVVYREIDDLAHTYPLEENPRIVDWLES